MQQQLQPGGQPNSNVGQVQNLPQDPGDGTQQESNLDESNLSSAGVLLAHNGSQSHLQQHQQKQAQAQALLEQQSQHGIPTLRPQLHPNSRFLHSGQGSPMAASQQQGMHLSGPQALHGLTRTASGQRLAQMATSSYNPSGLYQLGSSPSGGGLVSSPQMHPGQQSQDVGPRGSQVSMQQQGLVTAQLRGSQSSLQQGLPVVSGQGVGQSPPMMSMPSAQQQMPGMQPQQPSAAQQANLQVRMKSSGIPPQMQSGGSTYQGMQPMGASLSGPQPSRPAGNIVQQPQQRIMHSGPKFQQQQQQSAMSSALSSSMQQFSMTSNLVQQSMQQQQWVSKQQGIPSPSYQAQYGMQRATGGQQSVQHQQHHVALHQQYLTSNHGFGSSPVSQGLPQGQFQSLPPSQPQQGVSMTHLAPPSQQPLSQTATMSEAHSQSQLQAPSSHLPPHTQPPSAQGYGSYRPLVSQHLPQQPRLQPSAIAAPAVQPGTPLGGQPSVAERRTLGKRRVQQLLAEIDPSEQLDPDAEDVLLEFVDHFIDTVSRSSCDMTKHRKSSLVDVDDVLLPLSRSWQIPVPGYEDLRANRKPRKF